MSDDDEIPRRTERSTRMVQDALEEMHRRRAEYRRARIVGSVTVQQQAAFQAAVVGVYDELRPHKDRVEDRWQQYRIDQINQLANSVTRSQSVSTNGGRVTHETVEKPYRIPCSHLLEWSHCLDEIARELGFASAVKDQTPHDDGDMEHLAWLLKVRGQSTPLENLPIDPDEIPDGLREPDQPPARGDD